MLIGFSVLSSVWSVDYSLLILRCIGHVQHLVSHYSSVHPGLHPWTVVTVEWTQCHTAQGSSQDTIQPTSAAVTYQRERIQSRCCRMFTSEITAPSVTKSKRSFHQCASFRLLNARSVGNMSTAIANLIEVGAYDVFLVTETCHTASDDTVLQQCVPVGYVCLDVPWPSIDVS